MYLYIFVLFSGSHIFSYGSNYVFNFSFAFCAKLSLWDVANACLSGFVQKRNFAPSI